MAIEIESEVPHTRVEVQVTDGDKTAPGQAFAPHNEGEKGGIAAPKFQAEAPIQENVKEAATDVTIKKSVTAQHVREEGDEENATCKRRKLSNGGEADMAEAGKKPDMTTQSAESPVPADTGEDEDMAEVSTCVVPATTPPAAVTDEAAEPGNQEEKSTETSVTETDHKAESAKPPLQETYEEKDEAAEPSVGEASGKTEPSKPTSEEHSELKDDKQEKETVADNHVETNGKTESAEAIADETPDAKADNKEDIPPEGVSAADGEAMVEKGPEASTIPTEANGVKQDAQESPLAHTTMAPESTGEPTPEGETKENENANAPVYYNEDGKKAEDAQAEPAKNSHCNEQKELPLQSIENEKAVTMNSVETMNT